MLPGDEVRKGRPVSQVTKRILSLLDDGEWHPQEAIVEEAMLVVAPGVALRQAEANRRASSASEKRVKNLDKSFLIRSGQRAKTIASISSLVSNGRMEREVRAEGEKWIRLVKPLPRILIIQDKMNVEVHTNNDVTITYVDVQRLWSDDMTIEQIEEVMNEVMLLPDRFPGRRNAINAINIALVVKRAKRNANL